MFDRARFVEVIRAYHEAQAAAEAAEAEWVAAQHLRDKDEDALRVKWEKLSSAALALHPRYQFKGQPEYLEPTVLYFAKGSADEQSRIRAGLSTFIDAKTQHNPGQAERLIRGGIKVAGTQKELAARLGVTRDYLLKLQKGDRQMSYSLQVAMEQIIKAATTPNP